jgi:hypothetical protein
MGLFNIRLLLKNLRNRTSTVELRANEATWSLLLLLLFLFVKQLLEKQFTAETPPPSTSSPGSVCRVRRPNCISKNKLV